MTTQRNSPCPCGSGIKYKRCCRAKQMAAEAESAERLRREQAELMRSLREDRHDDGTLNLDGMRAASKLSKLAVMQMMALAIGGR